MIVTFLKMITAMMIFTGSSTCVNIAGIDRALLIQNLYSNAWVKVTGVSRRSHTNVSIGYEEAQELVGNYINYYNGRAMNIKVPKENECDELDTKLYNHENGQDAAERVVESLRHA